MDVPPFDHVLSCAAATRAIEYLLLKRTIENQAFTTARWRLKQIFPLFKVYLESVFFVLLFLSKQPFPIMMT